MADKTVDKLMKPIGSTQNPFSGIFDGNGFAISNLSMSAVDGGLFHTISAGAKVSNLILRQPIINSNGSSGLLARTNNGQISDCAVIDGRLVSRSGANLGGIVYENNDQGVIERTFVAGGFVSCEYTNYPTTIGDLLQITVDQSPSAMQTCLSTRRRRNGSAVSLGSKSVEPYPTVTPWAASTQHPTAEASAAG